MRTDFYTGGIDYINDSKATNLAATAAAVRSTDKPVRLLAGGELKEENITFIKEILAERVLVYTRCECCCT